MIPKIIHYCWFGNNEISALTKKCINSWKRHLPDYEIRLWNEDTFDINSVEYVREAYEAKKYAFVADYVRLYAIYNFGGIYMDTDVEVIKNLDEFLAYPAFTGFENDVLLPTGIIGSEKFGEWAKEQIEYYNNRKFIKEDGKYDYTTNVKIITSIMSTNGFILKNGYRVYKNCMHVFPKDYFCPKTSTGVLNITNNTYCIHHFAGSWNPRRIKLQRFFYRKILGPKFTDKLIKFKKSLLHKVKYMKLTN